MVLRPIAIDETGGPKRSENVIRKPTLRSVRGAGRDRLCGFAEARWWVSHSSSRMMRRAGHCETRTESPGQAVSKLSQPGAGGGEPVDGPGTLRLPCVYQLARTLNPTTCPDPSTAPDSLRAATGSTLDHHRAGTHSAAIARSVSVSVSVPLSPSPGLMRHVPDFSLRPPRIIQEMELAGAA